MFEMVDPIEWSTIVESIDSDFGAGITKKLLKDRMPVVIKSDREFSYFLISSHLFYPKKFLLL